MSTTMTYDEAHAMSLETHRNGVSGWPFAVSCDTERLAIHWSSESGAGYNATPDVQVPLSLLQNLAAREPASDGLRAIAQDAVIIAVFDDPEIGTAVAVTDPTDPTEVRTAVFDVRALPDVRFNSCRGDRFHDRIIAWAETHSGV